MKAPVITVLTSLFIAALAIVAALLCARMARCALARARAETQEHQARIRSHAEALDRLDERLAYLERVAREQLAVEVVLGNLLVEKGVIDEEEIEEAHRRLVIEPARISEEQEALLADLPDREDVRQRMVRNLPTTLQ